MKTLQDYTLVICPETNGTFVAYVPAIPGCHDWGRTSEEARTELANVFDMIQEEYQEENRTLPLDVELVVAHAS
ncbi:MAG: type II toxin-antitoxin system HicB family antitoxin [Nodosilinea sp. LVE1205-7]|jgi:predicted RNase H-like HicB family nuclease